MKNNSFASLALWLGVMASGAAEATTITINNVNAAGVGFNDPTPTTPLASNPGTTLGQQRLNVFLRAANQWAQLLNSSVTIVVDAAMTPLTCTATTATLGSAGPTNAAANFANAPLVSTTYNIAEANALAGVDIDPGNSDITANFNVNLGNTGCLDGAGWWYGTDASDTPPAGRTSLLPVVFHELGHGLGFTSLVNSSGSYVAGAANPPIWSNYLYDTATNKTWRSMTNAQRATSSTNDPNLVWTGARTNKQAGEYLKPGNALIINSPGTLPSPDSVGTASFGPTIPAGGITGDLVLVNDNVAASGGGTTTDACESPFSNSVSGKIALVDRGLCNFTQKVKNAQLAGALAVIIVNNTTTGPFGLGGTDNTVTIPSYGIAMDLGMSIKSALGSGAVNVTLGYAQIDLSDGCIRMFAPSPFQSGSSVSHFHSDATPNLLMEPTLNANDFDMVDLTLPFFADIGWSTNKIEDFIYTDNFDPNVCQHVQP